MLWGVVAPLGLLGRRPACRVQLDRMVALGVHAFQLHAKTPQACHVFEDLRCVVCQGTVLVLGVAQGQAAVTAQIDVPNLDVGLPRAQVVLQGQCLAKRAVAGGTTAGLGWRQ